MLAAASRRGDVAREAEGVASRLRAALAREPQLKVVPPIDFGAHQLTDYAYAHGLLFFYLLRASLGNEPFLRLVREYYQAFADRGGSTADLQQIAKAAGRSSVTHLFEDWMFSTRWTSLLESGATLSSLSAPY